MKKYILFFITLGLFIFSDSNNSLRAQDVGIAAKNVYHLLADSLGVRMYDVIFNPGDVAPFHMHPDHAIYVLEAGTLEITDQTGSTFTLHGKPGMALIAGPESHTAKNTGTTRMRAIVVEIMRPRK